MLLCVSLILPILVSCADPEDDPTNPNLDVTEYEDNIPEGYSLNGDTVGVLYPGHIEEQIIGDNETLDIVYTKIYERNLKVAQRLNCDLQFIHSGTNYWEDFVDVLRRYIQTLDSSFEIVMTTNNTVIQEKLFSLFHNLNDSLYIDIDQEWWYKDAILELSVDNYYYRFLYGDILLGGIGNAGCIFYNKDLYGQYVDPGNPDGLYDYVFNGTWTFERFSIEVSRSYINLGGENDIHGYSLFRYGEPLHYFPVSCDVEFYQRDDDGMPVITVNNQKAVEFTQKLYDLLYNNPGAWLFFPNQIGAETQHATDFMDGKVMFSLSTIIDFLNENMRAMEDNFGVLPYPKWDEQQEEYITMMANGSTLVAVPKSVSEDRALRETSAVIEAMCSEAYQTVAPAFYETACKRAYSRDDTSAEILDIITGRHETVKSRLTKNFLYEYSSSLSGIGTIFQSIMSKGPTGNPNFTSTYESMEGAANTLLQELITQYIKGA